MNATRFTALGLALALVAPHANAQTTRADTVTLFTLQQQTRMRDPRVRQLDLLASQSRLRLENLRADRKPQLSLDGQAQYQSDVAKIPIALPGGITAPTPPHDTYDARVGAQYKLYDATLAPRQAVERAQFAELRSRVMTSLYATLQSVNDAFFAAVRAETQIADLETTITDLDAQITVAVARVREGTALPSEENILRAELLRRRQSISELGVARRAALDILADLTGQPSVATSVLVAPDLSAVDVVRATAVVGDVRSRPEYDQFARAREVLDRQRDVRAAQDKPRVSAFGRAGYGRPGLNPLNDKFDSYWLGGVQLQWTPWNWGTTDRDREVLAIQRDIVAADEQAFTESLKRAVRQDLATIDRLTREVANDDAIVSLRENVAAESRARFAESVITSAELVDRETDVLSARLNRSIHRVELAQARARLLTTLGIETR
jgi:outer membrane protein TolC